MAIQENEVAAEPKTLMLTDKAVEKVAELIRDEGPEFYLRVEVQPGGCSGLRYALYFDDRQMDDDVEAVYGEGVVRVRTNRMSAPYLKGARLDWLESLEASGFTIDNPQASGTCACGDSFH